MDQSARDANDAERPNYVRGESDSTAWYHNKVDRRGRTVF
jgi:hypothetical protein